MAVERKRFYDVLEMTERTAELDESWKRLTAIVDSIADGFFAIDREWRFTHVNDEALRHFNKKREDMIGHAFLDAVPEDRDSVFEKEYRHAMESGRPVHFESSSMISDRVMEVHAYPAMGGLTVLFRNVTAKYQMIADLRETRDRAEWLGRLPEENPSPVVRVSGDGNILYCNPASMALPGWQCAVGRQPNDHFLPLAEQAMATGKGVQEDMELGGRFYSVFVMPITAEGYLNIYGRDITDRKQAEAALRKSEARWNAVIENFGESAIIATEEELVIYWNPAARALHGFTSAEEGIGPLSEKAIMFQLWTPDGRHLLELDEWPMRRIKRGETVRNLELRLRRPDQGWEKIVSYSGAMVETASSERLIFLSVYDLTDLRKAEEALYKLSLIHI